MIYRARAPLRLGFGGGGTDVSPYCDLYGGYTLNSTIDMYAYCTIEPTNDGKITLEMADAGRSETVDAAWALEPDGPFVLHRGAYNRIVRDHHGGTPLSFKMTTYCDAPPGSGLGSSSTLMVAILRCFAEWLQIPLGEYDLAHIAFSIERIDLKLQGGRQDQYAAAFGGTNFIEFYSDERVIVNPLRIKKSVIDELESSLVVYFTGISRDSGKIIEQQRRNSQNNHEQSIMAMDQLKGDALRMKEALLRGELKVFAERLGKSWEAKKRTADCVSNAFVDKVYDTALEAGAVAGKVSGAGGGGFMMFIVDPIRRCEVVRALNALGGRSQDVHFVAWGAEGWKTTAAIYRRANTESLVQPEKKAA